MTVEDVIQFEDDRADTNVERLRETIGQDDPLVSYVGNLVGYQGIDLLLESFRHTLSDSTSAQLVLIGGLPEDVSRYERKAANLGLETNVHFVGPRPVGQLGAYLMEADIPVSPRTKGNDTPMKIYSYLAAPEHEQENSVDLADWMASGPPV